MSSDAPTTNPGEAGALGLVPLDGEFLRRLLASSPDCVKILDLDGNLLAMNEGGRKTLEIGDLSAHLRTCWTNWWREGDARRAASRAVAEARAGGTGRFEAFAPTFGGTPRWWDVVVRPIPGPDGQPERLLSVSRDVTERHQTEQRLAWLAEQRRLALDSAQMGWWHLDLLTGKVELDDRFQDIFGSRGDRSTYGDTLALLDPEDRPRVETAVQAATRPLDPLPFRVEYRVRRPDGTRRWVRATGSARFEGEGPARQAVSFAGTVLDITEDKQARRALVESEARFRQLADSIPQQVWAANPEGLLDYHNRQCVEYFGPSIEPVGGDGWRNVVHPEDLPRANEAWATALRSGEPYKVEFRLRRVDGAYRWHLARALPLRGPGGGPVIRWLGTNTDIQDRRAAEDVLRESETRFRQLADVMPQMVWTTRADGYHEYFNRPWYEYTGTTLEETRGDGWSRILHPDDYARTLARWQHSLDTGESYEIEYRFRRASDGAYRWFLGRALPVRDAAGRIERWAGTCTDIEDAKRIEAEIARLADERERLLDAERAARGAAERTSRMKDEFLATLSHELRTPLNAILGWAQILSADLHGTEDLAQGLAIIERNARAQNQIIEDLLDMGRIISGKVRLDVRQVDLAPVVQAALETVRPAADAKGIRLQPVLDPRARPVSGDPDRLQQVFWNLLSNAIKFTPKAGRVQVRLERVHSHLEVAVADTGQGIAPDFLPFVFDRFRQADASSTRGQGGLGLGLAIVKQLVELHGGTVDVRSDGPGQGSTFVVALPLTVMHHGDGDGAHDHGREALEDPTRRHPRGNSAASPPRPDLNLAGVHVLVVDDEVDARALVRRLLESHQATVRTASSAAEAMKLFHQDPPDVLVSDVGMPGEDGHLLIRRVRSLGTGRGGDVPAIALTAYARAEDRVKAVLAGFQLHLAKPVEAVELLTMVASLAGRTAPGTDQGASSSSPSPGRN